jgi:transketolase
MASRWARKAVAATKKFFGFPEDQSFVVPDEALNNWRTAVERGAGSEAEWKKLFAGYAAANPELAAEFERTQKGVLKAGWENAIPSFPGGQAAGHAQRRRCDSECDCRGKCRSFLAERRT